MIAASIEVFSSILGLPITIFEELTHNSDSILKLIRLSMLRFAKLRLTEDYLRMIQIKHLALKWADEQKRRGFSI